MLPSLRRRSIELKVPLSRERVRLAETNKIRLQIEQLRYHCESIDPLDDTCDARWISLTSDTMRHVFDSQNQGTRCNKERSRALNQVRLDIMWDVCTHTSTTGHHECKLKAMD